MEATVTVKGIDELERSMRDMVRLYPDMAGDCLRSEAIKTRKDIVKNARSDTNTRSKSRMSLGRIGSYRVSQVQGYNERQYVEISARSPHFHLVERGHQIKVPYHFTYKNKITGEKIRRTWKNGGQIKGRVEGKFFLKKAKDDEQERFPMFVSQMVDEMIKKAGF